MAGQINFESGLSARLVSDMSSKNDTLNSLCSSNSLQSILQGSYLQSTTGFSCLENISPQIAKSTTSKAGEVLSVETSRITSIGDVLVKIDNTIAVSLSTA